MGNPSKEIIKPSPIGYDIIFKPIKCHKKRGINYFLKRSFFVLKDPRVSSDPDNHII